MNWAPLITSTGTVLAVLASVVTAYLARKSDKQKASVVELELLYKENAALRERDDMRSVELSDLRAQVSNLRFEVQWLRQQLGQTS